MFFSTRSETRVVESGSSGAMVISFNVSLSLATSP